ncbi:MAG: GerMN domain-containing protein [Candidatus Magnetomorum sp.]|nr:GerMN domain-containing protein [Candidatus Magnetomorum sp.]
MKKALRYFGMMVAGLLVFMIMIMSAIYYFDIGIADVVTHTEKCITTIIRMWDIQQETDTDANSESEKAIDHPRLSQKMVHLYFADETDRYLKAEDRVISHPDSPSQFAHILLTALFDGPRSNFNQVLPKGDFLRAVYIENENHTAYVDLKQTIVSHFPGGVTQELLTIYAIVNTLTLNIREIDQVKIIIGGQEADTLAGHLDIRYPYTTNMLMVR